MGSSDRLPPTYANGWINGLFAPDLSREFWLKIIFHFRSLDQLLRSVAFRDTCRLGYR